MKAKTLTITLLPLLLYTTVASAQIFGGTSITQIGPDGKTYEMNSGKMRVLPDGMMVTIGQGKTFVFEGQIIRDSSGQEFALQTESIVDKTLPPTESKLRVSQSEVEREVTVTKENGKKSKEKRKFTLLLLDASGPGEQLEFMLRGEGTHFPMVFAPGSQVAFIGTVKYRDYRFVSDAKDPLTVKLTPNELGFIYVRGKGTVRKGEIEKQYPETDKK